MKYILLKSKIFGNTKINLSEAIQNKKPLLKEDIDNIKEIEKLVSKEYTKNFDKVKSIIEDKIKKELNSTELKDKVNEIVVNCLVQFYKDLYNKRSIWMNGLK